MKMQDMTPGRNGFEPTVQELYAWLDQQILCTIATNGENGYPNAATVAFSQTKNLACIIITDISSRKASNMTRDGRAAVTITNPDDRYTVQLEGNAKQLSWDEFQQYGDYHYKKLPFSLPFKDIPGQVPFLINPIHIRFTDASVRPWHVTERNY